MTLTIEILYTVLLAMGIAFGMSEPMTEHAKVAHVDQATNAASMIETIEAQLNGDSGGNNGPCDQMQVHFCWYHNGRPSAHAKIICLKNERDLADGVIFGLGGENVCVVTGYTARRSYWFKSIFRDKCVAMDVSILRGWMSVMYPGLLH